MASRSSSSASLVEAPSVNFSGSYPLGRSRCVSEVSMSEAFTESTAAQFVLKKSRRNRLITGDDFSFLATIGENGLESSEGISWVVGAAIMANCTIGMGLLNFPHAFATAGGILPGMLMQFLVVIVIFLSLSMIGACVLRYGQASFQSVVGYYLGGWCGVISKILICISNFGASIVMLVVMGDQLDRLVWLLDGEGTTCGLWYLDRRFLVFICCSILIFPLCLLKSFEMFKWTSVLGIIAAVFISVGVTLVRYFTGVPNISPPTYGLINENFGLLKVIPIFSFGFECHIEIPPMVATLKTKSIPYFLKMAAAYIIISASVYTCGGIFGYLTFGDGVPGDLLLGYDRDDKLVLTAMVLLAVKIIATYPTIMYCVRLVITEIWLRTDALQLRIPAHSFLGRFCQVFPVFVMSVCVAVVAPGITEVISLIGALSAVFIFIFPGLCFIQMMLGAVEIPTIYRRIGIAGGAGMTVIGTFLTSSSFIMSIQSYGTAAEGYTGRCS